MIQKHPLHRIPITNRLCLALGLAMALLLTACATVPGGGGGGTNLATRPVGNVERGANEQRDGARVHEQVLARFGGVYADADVNAHVQRIGKRLVAVTEQANQPWTFTVLDTPDVNAFAAPGGYVYITRGLVALAGDEAQLAGVIAHEIGHVTAGHSAIRQRRNMAAGLGLLVGTLGAAILGIDPGPLGDVLSTAAGGVLASYSRDDEREADRFGIRYMADAGYDPVAQSEFMARLGASALLEARIAGRRYDPNQTGFFATHPATGDRVRETRAIAAAVGGGTERSTDRHLDAIDGMAFGESVEAGVVRGNRFLHRPLDLGFDIPAGHVVQNQPTAVLTGNRQGARLLFQGGRAQGRDPVSFVRDEWGPALARSAGSTRMSSVEAVRIGGLPAARALIRGTIRGRAATFMLVAIRRGSSMYRFLGLQPGGSGSVSALYSAAASFGPLTAAERRSLRQRRLDVVRVRPGDSEGSLARRMAVDEWGLELFRVLNGRTPETPLRANDRVKLVQ